jgi:hypothetical protein
VQEWPEQYLERVELLHWEETQEKLRERTNNKTEEENRKDYGED